MKAAVFTAPGVIEFNQNYTDPVLNDGVVLQVMACGICGTDIKALAGNRPGMTPPMILGHEFSGRVLESRMDKFKPGDRISVAPYAGCGFCEYCLNDHEELCKNKSFTPTGCFSEKVAIPADLLTKTGWFVPENVSWEEAALAEPLACVVLSLRACHWQPGASLLIVGGGFMGLLHAALAKSWGASQILLAEPNPLRRKVADSLGAITFDPLSGDQSQWAKEMTGGHGPDIVVTPVGIPQVVEAAVGCAASGGVVHIFGGLPKETKLTISAYDIHYKEISLIGTSGFRSKDYHAAADLIARKKIDLNPFISRSFTLEQSAAAFTAAKDQNNIKIIIKP